MPTRATALDRGLDSMDLQILGMLELDGRMSHSRLARKIGRSRSAVQERIARLEGLGHIAGYTIRRAHTTGSLRAYVLVSCSPGAHHQVATSVTHFSEVRVCDSVSGEADLALQVETREMGTLERILATIEKLPDVTRATTFMVIQNRLDRS